MVYINFKSGFSLAIFVSVMKSTQISLTQNIHNLARFFIFWKLEVFLGFYMLHESSEEEIPNVRIILIAIFIGLSFDYLFSIYLSPKLPLELFNPDLSLLFFTHKPSGVPSYSVFNNDFSHDLTYLSFDWYSFNF